MSIHDRHFNNTATLEDVETEQISYESVKAAFRLYRSFSINRVNKAENYLNSLPPTHQIMLATYREHLTKIRKCIDENHQIIRKLLENCKEIFINENKVTEAANAAPSLVSKASANGFHLTNPENEQEKPIELYKILKVQVTLKQIVRDWSIEGKAERDQCYQPIIDQITAIYNPSGTRAPEQLNDIKILVPGAGLGRLAYEFARRGYHCEGNEFSFFMLFASAFVLNCCVVENQYTIYPWIHQFVNNLKREDQISSVTFPDVSPTQAPPMGPFNMIAGDFLEVYTESDYWDCVATCFFIDCANNVAAFVENIYKILKPGGTWVNLGPLLYHYSDVQNEDSIEPTYEDLLVIIKAFGFEILESKTGIKSKYAQNPMSMHKSEYESVFFVCRKPLDDTIQM